MAEMANGHEWQTKTLGQIAETLTKSEDVLSVLDEVLSNLVKLAGHSAGWIFLRNEVDKDSEVANGFYLAAHDNLRPVIDVGNAYVWRDGCACQELYDSGTQDGIREALPCDRLINACASQTEYHVHTSVPLYAADRIIGILNVVAPNGQITNPRALDILTIVGAHLGTALDRRSLVALLRTKRAYEQSILLNLSSQLSGQSRLEDIISYLVEEVVKLFQVDACALLLPDEQPGYLVFRASAGWHSDPVVERRRVSGDDHSSSGLVMRTQKPVLSRSSADRGNIPEMTIDWLEAEEFEGLAIIPLIVEGSSIGALTLAMRTPREFDEEEVRFLQIVANQAGIAIVNARLHKEELRLQRLEEELAVGRNIQRSLLPATAPAVPGWQFDDTYRPARQVGGDMYDYFELPFGGDLLGFVIGDVADKGVPAALFMATSRTLIRSVALAGLMPASTLVEANRLILQDSPSELFLSAFYGIMNTRNGSLNYANAGHNPPLLYRQMTGEFQTLSAEGIVLCVLDKISLEEKSVNMASGDILVLYTDGVTEAMDVEYREFGLQRLQHAVAANAQKSATQILEAITEAVESFIGDMEQPDDLTLVVVKRL